MVLNGFNSLLSESQNNGRVSNVPYNFVSIKWLHFKYLAYFNFILNLHLVYHCPAKMELHARINSTISLALVYPDFKALTVPYK